MQYVRRVESTGNWSRCSEVLYHHKNCKLLVVMKDLKVPFVLLCDEGFESTFCSVVTVSNVCYCTWISSCVYVCVLLNCNGEVSHHLSATEASFFNRIINEGIDIQGGSNMTGTDCLQFTHKKSRSYLNHLVC